MGLLCTFQLYACDIYKENIDWSLQGINDKTFPHCTDSGLSNLSQDYARRRQHIV